MNTWKIWTVIGAAAVLLSGCGVPTTGSPRVNQTSGSGADNTTTTGNQTTDNGGGSANNTGNTGGNTTNSTTSDAQTQPLPATKTIKFDTEGMTETKQANLVKSTQGYYIYVLGTFEANAEEPGIDDVMMTINKDYMMQITMLPSGANLDTEIENAKQSLQALGTPTVDKNVQSSDPYFQDKIPAIVSAQGHKTFNKKVIFFRVSGVTFKIVTQVPWEAEDIAPLYAMIKTIGVLNAK